MTKPSITDDKAVDKKEDVDIMGAKVWIPADCTQVACFFFYQSVREG